MGRDHRSKDQSKTKLDMAEDGTVLGKYQNQYQIHSYVQQEDAIVLCS